MPVILVIGEVAISPFRRERYRQALASTTDQIDNIVNVSACHIYFCKVSDGSDASMPELMAGLKDLLGGHASSPLKSEDFNYSILEKASEAAFQDNWTSVDSIKCSSNVDNRQQKSVIQSLFVMPRPGTVSPWSSKATDIARICELANGHIERIERGLAWQITFKDDSQIQLRTEAIFDRMTQICLDHLPQGSEIFPQSHSPLPLKSFSFASLNGEEIVSVLNKLNIDQGLALSDAEIAYLASYLLKIPAAEDRKLTDAELFMFAQVNSEHCRHKIFKAGWTINGEKMPHSLFKMIQSTHDAFPEYTISAYSDNAAVFSSCEPTSLDDNGKQSDSSILWHQADPKTKKWGPVRQTRHFLGKVETHNHPTAISPYPGAATGSGGEIRDEGAVGLGSQPKAGLCGFAVSDLNIPGYMKDWEHQIGKPDHIASALDIMLEAPLGSAAYNNEFGRPCIAGFFTTLTVPNSQVSNSNYFGFHKPIMLAGGIGSVQDKHALKQKFAPGSLLVVLGGPAMLIGLGGGASSSMHSSETKVELDFASVQRDNAEMERRCQLAIDRLTSLGSQNPILSIHDVGAGGLSNALPELVHDSGLGADIDILKVPNADSSMSPMQIWCCEAQERYVLAIDPLSIQQFSSICERERCPFAVVGVSTAEQRLIVRHKSQRVVDIDMATLFGNPPRMERSDVSPTPHLSTTTLKIPTSLSLDSAASGVLQAPSVASKSFLITIGDRSVGGLVAQDQMVGPWQIPVADVGVTMASHSPKDFRGEAMAIGEKVKLAMTNARRSAKMAAAEALMNLCASDFVSLERIRFSANWMSAASEPGEGSNLYNAVEAITQDICLPLGVTIPVGKDSMSMKSVFSACPSSSESKTVVSSPLSVIVTAFCPVSDVRNTWTPCIQRLDTSIDSVQLFLVDLAPGKVRMSGSTIAQVLYSKDMAQFGGEDSTPDVDVDILKCFLQLIPALHKSKTVVAYHDISDGGLFTTLSEMIFCSRQGMDLFANKITLDGTQSLVEAMFKEELGAVMAVKTENSKEFLDLLSPLSKINPDCLREIGIVNTLHQNMAIFTDFERETKVYEQKRSTLQRLWARTSYEMQKLRDNPSCAEQEYEAILDDSDPGLYCIKSINESSIPKDSLNLMSVNPSARPKVMILREQGTNGYVEMSYSFYAAGFDPVDVHMTDLLKEDFEWSEFKGIAACGGFSFGDVLGAGTGWAKSVLLHPRLSTNLAHFFNDRKDTFAIGLCNGCQFFSQLKNIIDGCSHWPQFVRNTSEQYEARVCMIQVDNEKISNQSVFLRDIRGSEMPIIASHAEGRASFDSEISRSSCQVAVRYLDNYGQVTERFPFNPNGSEGGVSGVESDNGRILIMMPHPERVSLRAQCTWMHANDEFEFDDYDEYSQAGFGPWFEIFKSARRWVG